MTDFIDINNITLYISIISSCLLTISEILPYIQKIQSNGIMELIISFLKNKNNYNPIIDNSSNEESQNKLYDSLNSLTNELNSCKQVLQNYLNYKKINISIS
jgi:histidyl-tRNA synthetase